MTGPDALQTVIHHALGQRGPVAFAAQVAKVQMTQLGGHELLRGIGGGFVREMAMAAEDALLETPGPVRAILQQLDIVIGFEQQNIGRAQPIQDEFGHLAEVGQKSDIHAGGAQKIPDRILGVVQDVKRLDSNVADFKTVSRRKESAIELGLKLKFNRFLSRAIAINRNAKFLAETSQALDMVRMLVGKQDCREVFRGPADGGQALADLPETEPGINEDPGLIGFHICAIARRTTPQNRQTHWHGGH